MVAIPAGCRFHKISIFSRELHIVKDDMPFEIIRTKTKKNSKIIMEKCTTV